ncbi:hypothetical protein [uncultured Methylobacterium sp.]|jgi:nitric oxide reductase NorD protein|uniref:hypothetical protein n=1 Tax=uncultured Methylobacterium sp. TaxID=157278 RepID=UPI00262C4E87|nr:hypothetical protein [uncultured Methylobacterium sp.]
MGERRRAATLRALWGIAPPIATRPRPAPGDPPQRPAFAETGLVLPHGDAPARRGDDRLAEASLAHLGAHLVHGGERFAPGSLKPVQVALVSLIEDARVEALALRERPGLLRLWRPFHKAGPGDARTATGLMARLARALLDGDHDDPDPFVRKGVALFRADPAAWTDPALSRRIGDRLGNDLGQMRLPFSPRSYTVEPAYRDDHSGLWQADEAGVAPREEPAPGDAPAQGVAAGPAAEAAPEPGRTWLYPEWDHRIGCARRDFVTLREEAVPAGAEAQAPGDPALTGALHAVQPRRLVRLRRRVDGDDLDLAAALDAAIHLRARLPPDPRVYVGARRRADAAPVLLLVDASQSTADPVPGEGIGVLDAERIAAGNLARALDAAGIPFAVRSFRSAGRRDARIGRIKDWHEPPALAVARLAGLRPGLSTRLGAALRHAGRAFPAGEPGTLLVLTDGEPADIDVYDPAYLVEDARAARRALAARGLAVYGIGLTDGTGGSLARIFGRGRFVTLRDPRRLARHLARLAGVA